jgi:hypothetical protein
LLLAFEFLQQVGLEVGAAGHFQHVEDRRERDVVLQRMLLVHKELEFLVQVLQPQQRANPLVERVFVDDQSDIPLGVGWRNPVILNHDEQNYKRSFGRLTANLAASSR